jgi:hypothetical protein
MVSIASFQDQQILSQTKQKKKRKKTQTNKSRDEKRYQQNPEDH